MLPTGAGKTVCYAIPALISGGVTVVVCPLLSLMLDQVNRLRAKDLNVCYILSLFFLPITHRSRSALASSPSGRQVFLRDFRLSLAKRPEKLLVKTRPLSTPEFRPCTLWDTSRFILVVNNMSCAIFRSENLELLLHTSG